MKRQIAGSKISQKRTWRLPFPVLFLLSTFLIGAPVAMGAEGGGDAASSPLGWVFRWINFAIVFVAIVYVFAKLLAPWFRTRASSVGTAISEAAQLREEAERRLHLAAGKLAGLEKEVAEFQAASERDVVAERERIREAGKVEAEKIARAGKAEIAAAERAAMQELRGMLARLATDRAEGQLRKQVTPQADTALVRAFVASIAEGRA